jgi:hypothetical protein
MGRAPSPASSPERSPSRDASTPDGRDALLGRLRERRRSLDEDTITGILAKKPR